MTPVQALEWMRIDCRQCGGQATAVKSSRTGFRERLAGLGLMIPVECSGCGSRSFQSVLSGRLELVLVFRKRHLMMAIAGLLVFLGAAWWIGFSYATYIDVQLLVFYKRL